MKHIRTSALLASFIIGSAAFAASSPTFAASTNTSADRRPPEMSASGFTATTGTGLAGQWRGQVQLNISTDSNSNYTGTFRILPQSISAEETPSQERSVNDQLAIATGSITATDNGDGTYDATFTDSSTSIATDTTLTLLDNKLSGTIDIAGTSYAIDANRGGGNRFERQIRQGEKTGTGETVSTTRDNTVTQTAVKSALSDTLRIKLDAKLDTIDSSKRQDIYTALIEKIDTMIEKATRDNKKALLEGVRDHIQSRLDSEFPDDTVDADMLDTLFTE